MLNALWMHDACHRRPLCAGMRACCSHFWITCCVKTLGPQDCKILGVQSLPCFGFSDFFALCHKWMVNLFSCWAACLFFEQVATSGWARVQESKMWMVWQCKISRCGCFMVIDQNKVNRYPSSRATKKYRTNALKNASICFFGFW